MNNRLVRHFMAILAGAILGFAVVALLETAGHLAFPPPAGTDLHDPAALSKVMEMVPLPAKLMVVLAWFLGALAGGWAAARIARDNRAAWIIAGIFILMTALTIAQIPHPLWMIVAGLVAPLLAGWLVTTRLANRG